MTSSDTIINTVKKQDNKNKNLPDEYDYSLEDIFSHMDSFEIFDNDYESLLRRIETFKDQTNKDSIPLHTMNTALQYMEHYLDLIQKEERRLDEKITHAKKQNHQRSVGVLILTKQKV